MEDGKLSSILGKKSRTIEPKLWTLKKVILNIYINVI